MIIKGGSRTYWRNFADYLMTAKDNERVSLVEIRGLAAETVLEGFRELDLLGRGTRSRKFYYHASINPREGEELTPEQWEEAVDRLEENLGLAGQPRMRVRHDKDGRAPHEHVVWSRVDTDTMTVIPDSHNFDIHMRTADALEKAFAHQRTQRSRGREGRSPEDWEHPRGRESGIAPEQVAADLSGLWRQCDTGPAFAAALAEQGYILAKGDRRDFCVIDPAANEHSLPRRLGVKAAEVRDRMAQVDRAALPTVAEARAIARERASAGDDDKGTRSGASDRRAADKAVQGMVHEVACSAMEHAATPRERPAREPSHEPREPEKKPAAAPALAKPQPSLFERLARKLTEAAHVFGGGPTAAESLEMREHAAPAGPEPTAFELAARALIQDAKDAAPAIEGLAAVTTAAREHRPAPEQELSAFERRETADLARGEEFFSGDGVDWRAQRSGTPYLPEGQQLPFERPTWERYSAKRDAGDDRELTGRGIDWRARQSGTPFLSESPPEGEPLPFDRLTWEKFSATRDNEGEPVTGDGHGFWQRARARAVAAYESATDWIKERAAGFAERFADRKTGDHERER